MSQEDEHLDRQLERQAKRLHGKRQSSLLGMLITGGTAGLLLTVPLVGGAYLGRWIDEQSTGYSMGWTINLMLLGLAVGIYNVYVFFRDHGR